MFFFSTYADLKQQTKFGPYFSLYMLVHQCGNNCVYIAIATRTYVSKQNVESEMYTHAREKSAQKEFYAIISSHFGTE